MPENDEKEPSLETRVAALEAKVVEHERFINLLIRNDGERARREEQTNNRIERNAMIEAFNHTVI